MKLSIIMPVYNEEDTVIDILKRVNDVKLPVKKEIIVVDDGSKDNSRKLLEGNKKLYTKLIKKRNGGKGSALRRGFREATGDFIVIQDADLEYEPEDYNTLLEPVLDGEVDVVYGSRFHRRENHKYFLVTHYIGNKVLSLLFSLLFWRNISDMETCYKLFRREVLDDFELTENDFRIEPELTAKIIKSGREIKEVDINYTPRGFEDGKKIGWKDGFVAIWALIKYRFT